MKLLILSDANSVHTMRWIQSIKEHKIEIVLFSFFMPTKSILKKYNKINVKIVSPNLKPKIKNLRKPNISKIRYLGSIMLLRSTIKDIKPTVIHAHYASSYGLLGWLCRFKPFILSVWGSDVYYFPYKNLFNKWIMRYIIHYPNALCSTSFAMKKIIENDYRRKDVKVIPFGVDINLFQPENKLNEDFTVGTIKSIESHNGIENILEAAKIIIHDYNEKINFLIIGGGTLLKSMKEKAKKLGLEKNVCFTGHLNHEIVVKYYSLLSVFIAVSKRESFGVSVVEASASGVPSITSNIGGLTEVNLHNKTGLVLRENNPHELADSIMKLYKDNELRVKLGNNARNYAAENFNWKDNVNQMIDIYKEQP